MCATCSIISVLTQWGAYPEMGMGRELLRLNLGMYEILELRHTQITGKMRQAFKSTVSWVRTAQSAGSAEHTD